MKNILRIFCLLMTVLLVNGCESVSSAQAQSSVKETPQNVQPPKEWTKWLNDLQKEMRGRGISQKTLDAAYKGKNYYHPAPKVVQHDKKQTEFVLTTCAYVNRLVNKERVKEARKQYAVLKKKYQNIEDKYNVPLNYMVAFWGVETNFGQNKGKFNLIDSLTNLSYKNRRSEFFKNELYNVLKIMEKHNLTGEKIRGSWAGAMGHFQFMPSTYQHYAVDFDGDNVPDIWNSFPDALASAENYLTELGWKKDEPWGVRVQLPWDFELKDAVRKNYKTVAEWKQAGVKTYAGNALPFADDLKAAVMLPDGYKGPAYLVTSNFNRIMIWNHSDNYALAVAILADYAAHPEKKWVPMTASQQYTMNSEEILQIQKFYNRYFKKNIKEDGRLGSQTRAAVKALQKAAKLPQDGYPDYRLLQKVQNYSSKQGLATVTPTKKPRKK